MQLKNMAWLMAFTNLVIALTSIIGGGTGLFFEPDKEAELYLKICIIMGFFNLFLLMVLVIAIRTTSEKYVLLYILLELINLLIMTIFAVINMFYYSFIPLFSLLLGCLVLWYGLYLMYTFYWEIRKNNTVSSGAIEITCNSQINPLAGLPEKAVESTAV